MIQKVKSTIEEYRLLNENDKVVVAVSGGPDSMCLLDILRRMQQNMNIGLIVAHINHCTRGEESDGDEEYVKNYCQKNCITFYSLRVNIEKLAKEKGISTEMAGREARYEFFDKILLENGAHKIALAHNANDLAETVLMRIIRGTGLEGLEGIKPIRDGKYIRPILYCMRSEIEAYCEKEKINPRIDKTNEQSIYSRNKIRLDLIPYIREHFNADIINTINRLAMNARMDNEYFDYVTEHAFLKYCTQGKEGYTVDKELFSEYEAIITRVIRMCLSKSLGNTYNIERKHIYDVIELQKNISGKSINLPKNIVCTNNYGSIIIGKKQNKTSNKNLMYKLEIDKDMYIEEIDASLILKKIKKNDYKCYNKKYVKVFDLDKIENDIMLRYKREGDKITPLGMNGTKKIKKVFNEIKIPVNERESTPLLCIGDEVAWIVGYGISDKFKIDANTKNILQVEFKRRM